ncbi:MAG: hypothetical protein SGARI_007898, partial [Bacillariaceae sp.]
MHQRRQGQVTTTVPSGGDVDSSIGTNPIKKRRKRKSRKKKGDTFITTTQAVCVIVLVVFAITLVLRTFGTSSKAKIQTNPRPKKRRRPMSNGLYPRIDMPPSKVYQ